MWSLYNIVSLEIKAVMGRALHSWSSSPSWSSPPGTRSTPNAQAGRHIPRSGELLLHNITSSCNHVMITFVINYDYNLPSLLIISSVQVSLNDQISKCTMIAKAKWLTHRQTIPHWNTFWKFFIHCYCWIGHFHKKEYLLSSWNGLKTPSLQSPG